MYTLEFKIAETPDSPNRLLGAHWTKRAGYAKKWERIVWKHVWQQLPQKPLNRAKVTLTRFSTKKMDADNARSSFKPVMDALVKLGVLADDSPSVVGEPQVLQEKAPLRQKGIVVRIEEVA